MRHTRTAATLALAMTLAVTACGDPAAETPETLTLLAHDSFANEVSDETFAAFTAETGIEVDVTAGGDTGSMVNQAILTKDNPLADVMFGIDDTFLSRAVDEGVFRAHHSTNLDTVDESLLQPDDVVTPIDYGDVCFNYDKAWFEENGVEVPTDLDELPSLAETVTVEHPALSSPGLAFMLATIDVFGEDGWLDWWETMKGGGVNVANDWDTAYYGDFTRYGGASPIVMSYASSPPAEVMFSEEPLDEAPTGVIEAGCYRQVEYAGVLEGTDFPEAAGQLVDFMLSKGFQEGVPLTWFVFPANGEAVLPPEFVEHTIIPEEPSRLDPALIAENRERWIGEWSEVMDG